MVEPQSLLAHILAQTKENVKLLVAHKLISETDGEAILSRLLIKAENKLEDTAVVALTQRTQRLSMSPAPPKVEARAIWEWTSEDPNDLTFAAGEIIEIVAETNADWWTGRSRSGKQGVFPSNYVEKLPPQRSQPPIFVPEPRRSMAASVHAKGGVEQRYPSPALPYPPPPQPYPTAPQNYQPYYAPPAGAPPGAISYSYTSPASQPTPQAVTQQAPAKKSKFGGLGQMMMQSAASGAGFGAGAAIAGDIVHSIF